MSDPLPQLPPTPPTQPLAGPSASDEQRLQALLVEWILLREQGRDIPIAELCRDCPHLTETLVREIALYKRFEPAVPVETKWPEPPVKEFTGLRYQPLRYHAQGGLGVVFVARDKEVGRDVALKRIQERRQHLMQDRERFPREAEITGRLEHPGIVPVYSVGQDTSGFPYYTMRLIAGRTLAEALDVFHQGAPQALTAGERNRGLRALLNRFIAVCNTIGYAHSRGVIHRDLKPGNVLLGDYGETLVIDWGLAREKDSPVEEVGSGGESGPPDASSRTKTGNVMGTPGFMSPEQARGDWDHVGPASDVYSLGATLYSILTGRSPYDGVRNLEDIQAGKFTRPRQVSRAVPPALEAVCLKAMATHPQDRYSSALELGADVQRWLDDEPVQAQREPLLALLARWGRRHRTAAAAGVVLLAAVAVGLSLGLWAVGREQGRTREALKEAEDNLMLAGQAVNECFNIVKEHPIFQEPRMEQARKLLLEKTLPFYRRFRSRIPDNPLLQREEAEQWFRVAYIEQALGRTTAAIDAYEEARALQAKLIEAYPETPEYQSDLAFTHNNLGLLLQAQGKSEEALREYRNACDTLSKLVEDRPEAPAYRNALALTHNNLGYLLTSLGKSKEALEEYRQARVIQTKLVKDHPEVPDYQNGLARTHNNRGYSLDALGERSQALKEFKQGRALLVKLVEAHPEVAEYQNVLTLTYINRGKLLQALGKREEALQELRQAQGLQSKLARAHPDVPEHRKGLGQIQSNLGYLLHNLGKHEEAMEEYRLAIEILAKLAKDHPEVPEYKNVLALAHTNRGLLLASLDRGQEAKEEYEQARAFLAKLVEAHPGLPEYQIALALTLNNRGVLLAGMGRRADALLDYEQACTLQSKVAYVHPEVPGYQHELARTRSNLGELLASMGKTEEALNSFRQAEVIQNKLLKAHRQQPEYLEGRARTCLFRGLCLFRAAREHDSLTDFDQGITLLDELHRLDPLNPLFHRFMTMGLRLRARVLNRLGRSRDADADWDRLIALVPEASRPELRRARAVSGAIQRACAGDYSGAAAEAEALARTPSLSGGMLYDLACAMALSASAAARDSTRPPAEREKTVEACARQAITLLKRTRDDGYFQDPDNRTNFDGDDDLTSLRQRDDFRAFVKTLSSK